MATDSKSNIGGKRGSDKRDGVVDKLMEELTDNEIDEIFERARQIVKPMIKEEGNKREGERRNSKLQNGLILSRIAIG